MNDNEASPETHLVARVSAELFMRLAAFGGEVTSEVVRRISDRLFLEFRLPEPELQALAIEGASLLMNTSQAVFEEARAGFEAELAMLERPEMLQ